MNTKKKVEILLNEYHQRKPHIKECRNIFLKGELCQAWQRGDYADVPQSLPWEIAWEYCQTLPEYDKFMKEEGERGGYLVIKSHLNSETSALFALNNWERCGKVCYEIDDDLGTLLSKDAQELDTEQNIPLSVVAQFPVSGCFISTPSIKLNGAFWMDGMFVDINSITYRKEDGDILTHKSISFTAAMFGADNVRQLFTITIPYNPALSIQDALDLITERTEAAHGESVGRTNRTKKIVRIFLEFLMYLSSENACLASENAVQKDIDHVPSTHTIPVIHKVGESDGIIIRSWKNGAYQSFVQSGIPTGKTVSPHTRRGHWHHYWTGKRGTDERKLILKWTFETAIHRDQLENAKANITKVRA